MAKDIDSRLRSLDARRKGTDRLSRVTRDSQIEVLSKSFREETYIRRGTTNQKYTKYALGAMQAVDADYTRISLEEARRVGAQLKTGFGRKNIAVDFRLQGSVPCDIHIRGVSDVDLLLIDDRYCRYATMGLKAVSGYYDSPITFDTLLALVQIRSDAEKILQDAYPAATVDTSGAKAINLSGGSLRRPVDVIPSNWFDTIDYQTSNDEADRGIHILNKKVPERIENLPFKHIKEISNRDRQCYGGLKKSIRLCKNVKADAEEDGPSIKFSSYDIAATMWHSNLEALSVGAERELSILAETTRWLDFLYRNKDIANSLVVPDGSRRIFDTDEKHGALLLLSNEFDDLATKVAYEQSQTYYQPNLNEAVETLRKSYVSAF
ncbi:MAG: hypothetical protein EOP12_01635 [Pseudomonas sp.]|nr:MAG: hypothetical protein EOP12_01635 [Pseudomonas sp.]